jgi:poly-gamma-glutamate synthesis protein (capsule biosynthesis protein)
MRSLLIFLTVIIFSFIVYRFTIYGLRITSNNNLSPYISSTFPDIPTTIPTPTQAPLVTLGLVGDLGLGRHITSTARNKNNFNWSFEKISDWLLANDYNLANLESPIIANCPPGPTGTFTFCGDDRFVPELAKYRFILNLNNNHILNYGSSGLSQTKDYLKSDYFFDNFYTKQINGVTFGFLGYDFITHPESSNAVIASEARQSLLNRVSQSKKLVDYLIISIHWGNEYLLQPEKWRIDLAHQMVDAGADVIHGHHPHVWQGVEKYNNKLIFYSFGNFIFDQSWSYETSHSQIAKLIFQKGESIKYELFPIEIKFNSQPALMQ